MMKLELAGPLSGTSIERSLAGSWCVTAHFTNVNNSRKTKNMHAFVRIHIMMMSFEV